MWQLFIYAYVFCGFVVLNLKSTYFPIRLNAIVFMKHLNQESIYLHNNMQSYPWLEKV